MSAALAALLADTRVHGPVFIAYNAGGHTAWFADSDARARARALNTWAESLVKALTKVELKALIEARVSSPIFIAADETARALRCRAIIALTAYWWPEQTVGHAPELRARHAYQCAGWVLSEAGERVAP